MNESDREKSLERFVDRVLREQPLQSAPSTLAQRVFAEIQRRESLGWWQKGFQAWPPSARIAFAVASVALIAFAIEVPAWLTQVVDLEMPSSVSRGLALWHALMTIGSSISNSIPAQWIYAILGAIAMLYAACFGAGAAAYRALVATR
jgi:hypothetical protein